MTDSFEAHEQEFKGSLREFATLSDRFSYTQSDDTNKRKMIEDMKRILNVAEKKYKSMEAEASYLRREDVTARLRKFLMEFESAKKKLMNIDRDFLDKVGKKQLFERRDKNSHVGQKQDIKDRYIDSNDKAHDQLGLLSDAHSDMMSAIRTTQNSNQALVQDRERLENVDQKNKNINRMLIQAGQKEDKIYNREIMKRFLLWIAIVVLFVTDIFLIFHKLIK